MDDTTPKVETATPAAPSNETGTTPAPATDNKSTAELEAIRKELEQARMRNNQLANQLEEKAKADAEAKQKQLEEKEEFKTLYEQTQARLREIEEANQRQERQAQLNTATETVLGEYPESVVKLAKAAGLSLADDSEESVQQLKQKLDVFKEEVGAAAPAPRSNNPHDPGPQAVSREELVKRSHPGGESPMAIASARGDETVIKDYIRQLPAIQRMREIAQNGA